MYHQDWVMRQIQILAQAIAKLVFNKDVISYEINDESNKTVTDELYLRLRALLDENKINEAETLLFDKMDSGNIDYLALAIDFYQKLNNLSDDELKERDFSREEIENGLNEVKNLFGIKL